MDDLPNTYSVNAFFQTQKHHDQVQMQFLPHLIIMVRNVAFAYIIKNYILLYV